MKQFFTFLLFALFTIHLNGQISSSVKISTDSINIGQSVTVYYELKTLEPELIQSIDYNPWNEINSLNKDLQIDSTSFLAEVESDTPLEIKSASQFSWSKTSGQNTIRDTIILSFWDTGIFEIPHPTINTSDSLVDINYFQSPLLLVSFPHQIENPDTSSLILPINDIIREEKNLKDYLSLFLLLLSVIFAILLYLYFKNKKTKQIIEAPTEIVLPAQLIALDKLDEIKKEALWEKNEIKAYQSQLTFTIREYLENRFRINALESTTDEITKELKVTNIDNTLLTDLSEILQIADLVKFAKANPPEDLHEQFLNKAYNFVDQTKENYSDEEIKIIRQNHEAYLKALAHYKKVTS